MSQHYHFIQTNAAAGGFDITSFLPLLLIFVVFYFLLLRPQQKKMKQHQEMISKIQRGDRVVTNGGLIGTVSKVISDSEVQIDIAEGVTVSVVRSMISNTVSRTGVQAANEEKAKPESKVEPKKTTKSPIAKKALPPKSPKKR